jgi:hypothetical protein
VMVSDCDATTSQDVGASSFAKVSGVVALEVDSLTSDVFVVDNSARRELRMTHGLLSRFAGSSVNAVTDAVGVALTSLLTTVAGLPFVGSQSCNCGFASFFTPVCG